MVAVKFTCKIVINICITAKPLERVICVYQQTRTASAGDTTGEAYTHENNKLKARLHRVILSRDKSCEKFSGVQTLTVCKFQHRVVRKKTLNSF